MTCRVQIWSPVAALVYWHVIYKNRSSHIWRLSAITFHDSLHGFVVSYSHVARERENRSVFNMGHARYCYTLCLIIIFNTRLNNIHGTYRKNSVSLEYDIFESSRKWDTRLKRTNTFRCSYYEIIARLSVYLSWN